MRRSNLALAVAILGAALLRFYGVLRFPFEQDELYTVDEATNLFHTRLLPGIQARPVFFLLEHPFVKNLPHTELWLRLVPFLFGIAGLWAVWCLARDTIGVIGAAAALLLVALSPWHLEASGFARYYSLLFLLAALVYWLLPRAYDSDAPRDYLAALVPLLLGTWTHPSFVFPVAGAALAISLVTRNGAYRWTWPSRRAWTFLWGPFLLLSAVIFGVIRMVHRSADVANGGDRGLAASLRLVPAMVDWTTLTVAAAAVTGMLLLLRSAEPGRRRLGVMALIGTVCSVLSLLALSFVTAIYADYGIAALPLVLVAAAFVVQWVAESVVPARARAAAVATVVLLLAGMLPATLSHLSDGTRFDYRPAFMAIDSAAPNTAVLTWPIAIQRAYDPALRARELPTTASGLSSALASDRDLWAVVSVKRYGIVGDDTGEMARWLEANCRQAGEYQHPRLDYRMYRVDLWRCTASS